MGPPYIMVMETVMLINPQGSMQPYDMYIHAAHDMEALFTAHVCTINPLGMAMVLVVPALMGPGSFSELGF